MVNICRISFHVALSFMVLTGVVLGGFTGFMNELMSDKKQLEIKSEFKAVSYEIREALSRENGCSNSLATALVYPSRKNRYEKIFLIDGFNMPNGELLVTGKKIKGHNVIVEGLEIINLNEIGLDSEGNHVYTAKFNGHFSFDNIVGKKVKRSLANLLLTVDNRERIVNCSSKFSGDAVKIMVSLCDGSHQIYDRESGYCRSPRSMAGGKKRGISSLNKL